MTDPQIRALASEIVKLRSMIRGLSTSARLAHSSLEDGGIPEYDLDGNLVARFGKQVDGAHGTYVYTGPLPPAPTAATVEGGPGFATVISPGTFEENAPTPTDFVGFEIYASQADFLYIEAADLVGRIEGEDGGPAVVTREPGLWYFALVAVTTANRRSVVSARVTATVEAPLDSNALAAYDAVKARVESWEHPTDETRIDGGNIYTGTVTAAELDVLSARAAILTANVIKANMLDVEDVDAVTGAKLTLLSDGVRIYGPAPDEGTPGDPLVSLTSGDTGLAFADPTTGEVATSMVGGAVMGQSVIANESLLYRGIEMEEYLGKSRVVAYGGITAANLPSLTSGEVGLFELALDTAEELRFLEFQMSPFLVYCAGVGTVGIRLRYTSDGSKPSVSSPLLGYNYVQNRAAGYVTLDWTSRPLTPSAGQTFRLLVCLYSAGTSVDPFDVPENNIFARVVDFGRVPPNTAVLNTGGGGVATPVVKNYDNYYGVPWWRTYLGDGTPADAYDAGKKISQGRSPNYTATGVLKAMVGSNPQLLSDLNGASSIQDIWVELKCDWTHNSGGGTAVIGLHSATSKPSTFSQNVLNLMQVGFGRGDKKWVRLPSSTYSGFANGTYDGITLDPSPVGNPFDGQYYMQFSPTLPPRWRARFTK